MGVIAGFFRACATAVLFALFALGGAVITVFVMPFVPNRRAGQRVVRLVWIVLVKIFTALRLISVDASRLRPVKGRIIVANHPSLIDVVLLTAAMPGVFSVAKSSLRRNPFIGFIVSRVMLTDDEKILDEARSVLSGGGNVLIFPEGTRTPLTGESPRLHRGAAQLSVRLGVPVAPVRIEVSRRILAKHQSILDMGEKTVAYCLVSGEDILPPENGAANRTKAIELTRSIANALRLQLNGSGFQ